MSRLQSLNLSKTIDKNTKRKVYFMAPLKEEAYDIFKDYEIVVAKANATRDEMIEDMKQVDYVVSALTFNFNEEVFNKCPNVMLVNNYAVGFDNIDVTSATAHNVVACNCPDAVTISTAEHTIALLFGATRKVPLGHNSSQVNGCGNKLALEGIEVTNKTVGIIGAGAIGQKVAKYLSGFDCNFLYNKRTRDEEFERASGARQASLEELLKESDYVLLHCPLTPETENLINKHTLSLMKKDAILVNMARGKVVNHDDLIDALNNKVIRAAALDVYPNEPEIPAGLLGREDVVLSPHIAGLTHEAKIRLYNVVLNNIKSFENNEDPKGLLNK